MNSTLKIAFIHGRPKGHPTHAMYGRLANGTFFLEDRLIRWQDTSNSKLRRYLSWVINGMFFPKLHYWDAYFTEGVRIPMLVQKKLHITKKRQKLIALADDESLYFTYSNQYSSITSKLMKLYWETSDAIICVGEFQTGLAKKILDKNHHAKIYTIFNANPESRFKELHSIQPNIESNQILYIGHASTMWRASYKGLDLSIESFGKAATEKPELRFIIIGEIPEHIQKQLVSGLNEDLISKISFIGRTSNISSYLESSSLYLHCGKGEAWGISVTEAMLAGVPAMVTNLTGSCQIVKQLDESFVHNPDANDISKSILDYYALNISEKVALSEKSRQISSELTEEKSSKKFIDVFEQIKTDLNLH